MSDWLTELDAAIGKPPVIEEWHHLMAYCEHCNAWYKFIRYVEVETCPTCGGPHSHRINYQLTTERSFNPKLKRQKIK